LDVVIGLALALPPCRLAAHRNADDGIKKIDQARPGVGVSLPDSTQEVLKLHVVHADLPRMVELARPLLECAPHRKNNNRLFVFGHGAHLKGVEAEGRACEDPMSRRP
jgi:hypothetical protein